MASPRKSRVRPQQVRSRATVAKQDIQQRGGDWQDVEEPFERHKFELSSREPVAGSHAQALQITVQRDIRISMNGAAAMSASGHPRQQNRAHAVLLVEQTDRRKAHK